uniref:Protein DETOXIFICATION n=1 Tax=Steinernema glaseri TaxID=37863 RepID=A0A1I7ZGZ1_9BILA
MDSSNNLSIPLFSRVTMAISNSKYCREEEVPPGGRYVLRLNFDLVLQNGPQCGLVALINGFRLLGEDRCSVDGAFKAAKELEFTYNGEMFSPFWLADLANIICETISAHVIDFPPSSKLVTIANCESEAILIPYDCEKNGEPGLFDGHKSHWCVIIGSLVVSPKYYGLEECREFPFDEGAAEGFVFGLQGKSSSKNKLVPVSGSANPFVECARLQHHRHHRGRARRPGRGPHLQGEQERGQDDITIMHEAIPFLPVPAAIVCLVLNVILPGSGTIISGFSALCMGQPRINFKEGRKLVTLIVNFLVGISQFFTITFLFVGWFWSIAWGGLIIIHSMQYREALQIRRQEAVATAAIEALTKDSILHRRDVKTLLKEKKIQGKEAREKEKDAKGSV